MKLITQEEILKLYRKPHLENRRVMYGTTTRPINKKEVKEWKRLTTSGNLEDGLEKQ